MDFIFIISNYKSICNNKYIGIDDLIWCLDIIIKEKAKPNINYINHQIPKPDGSFCIISYCNNLRYNALLYIIKYYLDNKYKKLNITNSYGYILGVNGPRKVIEGIISSNGNHILNADITKYFDRLNHEILLSILQRYHINNKILRIILIDIKLGDQNTSNKSIGIRQGSIISPIISNFYLIPLDLAFNNITDYYRYVDNLYIISVRKNDLLEYRNICDLILADLRLEIKPATYKYLSSSVTSRFQCTQGLWRKVVSEYRY